MTDSLAAGLALAQVVEQAWQAVAARSVAADREAIEPLRQWLACQPNTHAAVLSGVSLAGAANDQSAREIEALLLGRVARKELTQITASQHLSLMYRVGKRLRRAGVAVTPTWISAILRPPPSPFPRDTSAVLAKVEAWRQALQRALSSAIPEDREHVWPLTALSAVLNGALIDRAKLIRLRQMLDCRELELHGSDGDEHAFIEFLMPFDGLGNHHLQRWWPDPATELLLARHPRGERPAFKATLPLLQQLLLEQGVPGNLLPEKISEVLRSARIWWAARSAPVDLHSMMRTFASHNLTSRCWRRLVGRPATREPGAIANPGCGIVAPPANAESESELLGAAAADHEWLHEVGEALKVGKPPDASAWPAQYLRGIGADDYRKPYVGWLAMALAVPARNPEIPPSLKTLAEPFFLAAPRLLNYLGERDVRSLDIAELDETYRIILDACESQDPIERIARGLRLFHEHLVREYKVPALPNPRATFGEGGSLMPVDATVISVDEYLAALKWLSAQLELGADPMDTAISRLVLVLTFRCGLRRGEVFGLRLCDVHDQAGIYLHVRRYPNHSLKTPNATRTIRIDVLMTPRERRWLRQWCSRQATGSASKFEPERQQWRLLSKPGSPQDPASIEGSVRRAMHAVHAVTKEPRLALHHLRHSCASWLWLKLRAPDYPELLRLLPSMPGLCRELGYARRLRVQLCGAVSGPSRMYSYVIARMLGHASPSTSLEHYLHVGDLFLAIATLREARTTPVGV